MKNILIALITIIALAGCTSARLSKLPKPEGRYSSAIYAAGSIAFSGDRASTLRDIAAKPDITEAEQIYLVEVLQVTDGFSGDKKAVLLSLLKNKAIAEGAKKRLSELLPRLGLFSADAKEVIDALAS